jgi:hypothetical protein
MFSGNFGSLYSILFLKLYIALPIDVVAFFLIATNVNPKLTVSVFINKILKLQSILF